MVVICASTSYLGVFVDVYVHSDDLGRAMTTMRVLIPLTNIMWLYTYCRWVRKRTITVYSKTSSYQTQHYSFSNAEIHHKCIVEDKPRERSLDHRVIICFRLGSVYDNVLKNITGKERMHRFYNVTGEKNKTQIR